MQISAFVDGELSDNEADLLLRRMSQDRELRHEVAEFLAIGRVMRGEASAPGVDHIHDRVLAALDDKPFDEQQDDLEQPQKGAIRPLIGFAVAASVALLAIFSLQQNGVDPVDTATGTAETVAETAYTVPRPASDQLREYYLLHGATTTENGANGMNARLVTLLRQQALDEPADDEQRADEPADEAADAAQQP